MLARAAMIAVMLLGVGRDPEVETAIVFDSLVDSGMYTACITYKERKRGSGVTRVRRSLEVR
jgi:hypothetical protein